jgi:hypothetical protein
MGTNQDSQVSSGLYERTTESSKTTYLAKVGTTGLSILVKRELVRIDKISKP